MIGINAEHEVLPLQVIVKGVSVPANLEEMQGRDLVICANKSAWMKEESFLIWIEKVF